MFRAAMLGKISVRSISSYGSASTRFVHPRQMRAIIRRLYDRPRPPGAPFRDSIKSKSTSKSRSKSNSKSMSRSHAHYLVAAIDIDDLPGDGCCGVTRKKHSSGAEFGGIATALQWRTLLIML